MTEFLKDWCHYMRKDELDEYELELVKSVEDTISQVNNYKTRCEKLIIENAKLRAALEYYAQGAQIIGFDRGEIAQQAIPAVAAQRAVENKK